MARPTAFVAGPLGGPAFLNPPAGAWLFASRPPACPLPGPARRRGSGPSAAPRVALRGPCGPWRAASVVPAGVVVPRRVRRGGAGGSRLRCGGPVAPSLARFCVPRPSPRRPRLVCVPGRFCVRLFAGLAARPVGPAAGVRGWLFRPGLQSVKCQPGPVLVLRGCVLAPPPRPAGARPRCSAAGPVRGLGWAVSADNVERHFWTNPT